MMLIFVVLQLQPMMNVMKWTVKWNYNNILKFKIMKLSLDALQERVQTVASTELMESISGGKASDCHTGTDWLGDFGPYELPH